MAHNYNYLRPNSFRLVIKNSPAVSFTCQEADIPEITAEAAQQATSFIDIPHPYDKLYHGNFNVNFIISESLENYMEIRNWMEAIGFPSAHSDYEKMSDGQMPRKNSQDLLVSDLSLIVLDSDNHELMVVEYEDAFPIVLDRVSFNVKMDNYDYATCGVTFAYRFNRIIVKS